MTIQYRDKDEVNKHAMQDGREKTQDIPDDEFSEIMERKAWVFDILSGVKVQAPLLMDRRRQGGRYGRLVETPNQKASMRLLYWYLKAKLEAVRFGMDDVFTAFMSRVINTLPDGTATTLGETVKEHPKVLQELLPTFEIKGRQLEDKRENVQDAEYATA